MRQGGARLDGKVAIVTGAGTRGPVVLHRFSPGDNATFNAAYLQNDER